MLEPANVRGARKASLPATPPKPQLATASDFAPDDSGWIHEIKYDGYRMLCRIGRKVDFFSRNGKRWTDRLKPLVEAVVSLPTDQAILDGEVVVFERDGTTSFQGLQNALGSEQLVYMVFDLLHLDGYDMTAASLTDRKALLAQLLAGTSGRPVRYSDHVEGEGPRVFQKARQLGTEGIISKRADRPYRPGRTTDWLKIKALSREEFVVGGYTDPAGTREGFGSLLLGRYDSAGDLVYCGRVGAGFSQETLQDLTPRLRRLNRKTSPFVSVPNKETGAATHWVRPQLVAQVEFSAWSRDGHLRHPVFQGLRADKQAKEVVDQQEGSRHVESRVNTSAPMNLPDLRMTHPEKLLYPEIGLTKLGVAQYYASIADWILPHVVNRPLSLVRCPDGWESQCFYQKRAPAGLPDHVRRIQIGEDQFLYICDLAGLLSLVQFGVLEIHTWGARIDRPERPDRLVFDLDPDPSLAWSKVTGAALDVRRSLEEQGLRCFLKTTGGKGLHVVVPIIRRTEWKAAKEFCRRIAGSLAEAAPTRYTTSPSKAARRGKVYIDYLRNSREATAVAPYSTRARGSAPVAMPLDWEDLSLLRSADQFNAVNALHRLSTLSADPWDELPAVRQSIS